MFSRFTLAILVGVLSSTFTGAILIYLAWRTNRLANSHQLIFYDTYQWPRLYNMHAWITLTIAVGVFVVVIHLLLFLVLFMKAKKGNIDISSYDFPGKYKRRRRMVSKGITFVDPYTGGSMSLEKVRSIDSLRSSRSVGFIEYQRSDVDSTISGPTSSMISGRETPSFGETITDAKQVSSMPPLSTIFLNEGQASVVNFNPIYEEELLQMDNESLRAGPREQLSGGHVKLRAKEISSGSVENEGISPHMY